MYILKFPIEVWLLLYSYLLKAEKKITFALESRQTLLAMANQLDKLIKNVSQLSDHAGQLQSQARMTKAVVDEIYTNRDYIKQVKMSKAKNIKLFACYLNVKQNL